MNKKSNIIIGSVLVGVVIVAILGMSLMSKGGKGNESMAGSVSPKAAVSGAVQTVDVVGSIESASSSGIQSGSFVASKQGKKYFPSDCGSAKTIKEENRVYFGSETEAQQAGYERTATCK
jgi:hypothetical protein